MDLGLFMQAFWKTLLIFSIHSKTKTELVPWVIVKRIVISYLFWGHFTR